MSPANFSSVPGALTTRGWPHQVGLAEVLPRRVPNLLGPRSSVASTPAEEGASLDLSLMMLMVFYAMLLLVLHCVPTKVPTRAKTTFCRFYSCSFGHADNARATGSSLVATKEKLSLQSRIHVILEEEDKEEELPSFGRCRPLCRVADSGPKAKVNNPYISALPSLKLYPCMCGLNPEPDLRPDLSPVNPSSTPGALTSRGRPNKGPADGYLLPEPREQPHQLGLAEVLPGRVRNLPGPRSSKPRE